MTINFKEEAWRAIDTKKSPGGWRPSLPSLPEIRSPFEKPLPKVEVVGQLDDEWKVDDDWTAQTACGPTMFGMMLKAFDEDANPAKMGRVFRDRKLWNDTYGTLVRVSANEGDRGGILGLLESDVQFPGKKKRYDVELIHDKDANVETRVFDYDKAAKLLKEGYLIAGSGMVNWIPWAGRDADHIFGIDKVDVEKRLFRVFDPGIGDYKWMDDRGDYMNRFHFSYAVKPAS